MLIKFKCIIAIRCIGSSGRGRKRSADERKTNNRVLVSFPFKFLMTQILCLLTVVRWIKFVLLQPCCV